MPAPIQPTATLVNTNTIGDELAPRMVRLADGGWVIIWSGRETVASSAGDFGVFGQRYDATGAPIGGEFQISSPAPGQSEYDPDIAALPDGGWIVTWQSVPPFTGFGDTLVYTRRYDAAGNGAPEVQVNAPDGYPAGMLPVIAVLADGGWVVALHSDRPDGDGRDIYGYRYDAAGSPVGSTFRINSTAAGDQDTATIAALGDGGWVVAWQSQGQDSSGAGVYSQRYDAAGNPVGGETLVNTTVAGDQAHPSVAALADGGWIVAWMSAGVDGSGSGVASQRYQASGALFGGENLLNIGLTGGDQGYPTVVAMPDGGYVVRWLSEDIGMFAPTGARQMGVYIQRHDSAGGPLAPAIRIGTTTEDDLFATALAPTANGWITAWAPFGPDGSGHGIYALTSNALPPPVTVINGTESDDFIVGTADPEIINGLGGNDLILGGDGDDQLNGGDGDDVLEGNTGVDSFDGGAGFDRVGAHEEEATQAAIIDLRTQTMYNDGYGNMETMTSIEAVGGGTRFADLFYGDDNFNLLVGSNGDTLYAFGGDDDFVVDGAPALLDGGDGSDRIGLFRQTRLVDLNGDGIGEMETTTNGVHVDLALGRIVNDGFGGAGDIVSIEHLSGSAGDDFLRGDDGDNGLAGAAGNDTLEGRGGNDGLTGDDGNDVLDGGEGDDFLDGGAGDDTLVGGAGWDSLNGGADNDTVSYANAIGFVDVYLGLGAVGEFEGETHLSDDSLSGIENVIGSQFDDAIRGDGNANLLRGLEGDDLLAGIGGDDTLEGGDGDDILVGGAGWDALDGGAGNNDTAVYAGALGYVDVYLGLGVVGEFEGDTHVSDDTLTGIEHVIGSQFDDAIRGDNNANLLGGLGGNDLLFGFGGDDLLQGGLGHDNLRGYDGQDTLQGGDGNDLLRGGNGDDVMDGGAGFDRASFFGTPGEALPATGVTVSLLLQGVAQNTGHGWDILTGFEALNGTAFDDNLTGDHEANWLLLFGGGNDIASGEGGDDLIQVADGDHLLNGGAGIDTVSFTPGNVSPGVVTGPVTVSLALQGAAQTTGMGTMTLEGFENLSGSTFDDALIGDAGANLLAGDAGNDTLNGGIGNDILYGDGAVAIDFPVEFASAGPITLFADIAAGNDLLKGGRGDDWLFGGGGDDELRGGKDDDLLTGGAGNDVLIGGSGRDTFLFGSDSGDDRITDFKNKDTIAFEGISGVDDFGDLTLTRVGNDTLISWGDGTNTVLVEGIKPNQFHASDFMFG